MEFISRIASINQFQCNIQDYERVKGATEVTQISQSHNVAEADTSEASEFEDENDVIYNLEDPLIKKLLPSHCYYIYISFNF